MESYFSSKTSVLVRKQLQRYKMDTLEKTFKNLNRLWQPQSRKKLSCSPLFPPTFSLSFLLSGLLSWVQMGFTDNFRIAYFFLLICTLFIFIDVDFIYLLSNHPESLDRDYIKWQFYYCFINNTIKRIMSHNFLEERKWNSGNIFQQWSKQIWLEWFPLPPTNSSFCQPL